MSIADNLCGFYKALADGGLPPELASDVLRDAARRVFAGDILSGDLVGDKSNTVLYYASKEDPSDVNGLIDKLRDGSLKAALV